MWQSEQADLWNYWSEIDNTLWLRFSRLIQLQTARAATGRGSFSTGCGLQLKRGKKKLTEGVWDKRRLWVCVWEFVSVGQLIWFDLTNLTNGFCGAQRGMKYMQRVDNSPQGCHWSDGHSFKQSSYESFPRYRGGGAMGWSVGDCSMRSWAHLDASTQSTCPD